MILFKKYKVINHKKFKRFVFILFIIGLLVTATTLYTLTAYSFNETKYFEVPVRAGDTIWNIAKEHGTNISLQKNVYDIIEFNQIEDAMIYPGQILKIPLH
jgi:nucleoid-associated protein YgaU